MNAQPLNCQACDIDDDCTGERWVAADLDRLASIVAIIIMGQSENAAHIIKELQPALPEISIDQLRQEAILKLSVQDKKHPPRIGYPRWQRDGLVFEAISWIAAKQSSTPNTYIKEPHVSATSQGLDGLILELSSDNSQIVKATILEDKCVNDPRHYFLQEVIPAFVSRHKNERCAEMISAASALLKQANISTHDAAKMSAAVTDQNLRCYRAAFALSDSYDGQTERAALFKNYDRIENLDKNQRIGASFITSSDMRAYIEDIANRSITFLQSLSVESSNV